jgi:acyl-CoA thioesterase II
MVSVGDLSIDTAVSGENGHYQGELSPDWEIWGPNGGYLASVALRAAGAHSRLYKPASFVCHFLGVAAFTKVELDVETIRGSKRAESIRVSMRQGGQRILEALVWTVQDGLDGLVHDASPAPSVPGHAALPTIETLLRQSGGERPQHAFFSNLEERPVEWISDWERRQGGDPIHRCWYRFRPVSSFDDNWIDACRLLIMIDTFQWPAAVRGHAGGTIRYIAPSLDLACRFHRLDRARKDEWLLVEARSPAAAEGLVGGVAAVWDVDGRLLATGGQQMLCRPATQPSSSGCDSEP